MPWLKRTSSNVLIGFGILFLLAAIASTQDQTVSREERAEVAIGCLLLGAPMTAWGGWLAWQLQLQKRQQEHDRLRSILFGLLQQNSTISVLQFAMAADLTGTEAKAFLDEQAKEFAANLDVTEQGDVFYRFSASLPQTSAPGNLPSMAATNVAYDVILESVPPDRVIEVVKLVQELTSLSFKAAKALVEAVPQPVKRNVRQSVAQDFQARLAEIGAIARIQPSSRR
jgi:large subunit ribosomal protein L7/L12